MPIYEYKCEECGNVHQELRSPEKMKKAAKCECGGVARFVLSRPARFQRGPGWASRVDSDMPGEIK